MSHPLLGDPGSLSALASSLRSRAVQLHADAEALRAALADAAPGWRGPSALERRRRAERLAEATATTAEAMDACGRTLHSTATELAEAIARLRALEEEARAAGLDVRDGTVERSWGITGVADAHSVDEAERVRASLQERVHHVVTTLGRHRTLLTAECARASELLRRTSAGLRA